MFASTWRASVRRMRQNSAFEERVELVTGELRQASASGRLGKLLCQPFKPQHPNAAFGHLSR